MKQSVIRVDGANGLVGSDVPFYEFGDASAGPTVSLMAGVHGCEYAAMSGLRRFLDELDESTLRGRLRVIPIANLASFHSRTAFVVPHDGLNLNRCFPGRADGSFTERLAFALFEEAIRTADFHIDMHSGDQVEALEPFSIYDASSVEEQSRTLGVSYGLPYLLRSAQSESPIAGTSSAAASQIGIPSITAEAGGRGLIDDASVQAHVDGVRRALSHLGVLAETTAPIRTPVELSHWVWLRSAGSGWWASSVEAGEEVGAGAIVGTVTSLDGREVREVTTPEAGIPLFLTTSPAVEENGLLLGLGIR
ncbi:MAG: succinylglutamate desuccinylase [Acidobacteria bacterium]|nr:succinylglutamate desuccinylase [Acidobacteriota bacterium]